MNVTQPNTKSILFVCVENANRSQMAEAFTRMLGDQSITAYSAGSNPSGIINPKAIEAMGELGYDLRLHESKSFDALSQQDFDCVVTMGCGDECPLVSAKQRIDWSIPDPKNLPKDEFRSIRNLIEQRVRALLIQLNSGI